MKPHVFEVGAIADNKEVVSIFEHFKYHGTSSSEYSSL